jgi:PTH1 family peptidyl-tRNA hydrolase
VSRWQLPRWAREGNARIARGRTPVGAVHLMKPLTYMNDSGRVLKGLRAAPGESIPDLLILVDDFALNVGTFRLRAEGSAGGHNGLKSVEATLGTRAYARLRIGVGPKPAGVDQAAFVLDDLPREERTLVKEIMPVMCEAVECWAAQGIERAMALYNRKQAGSDDPAA